MKSISEDFSNKLPKINVNQRGEFQPGPHEKHAYFLSSPQSLATSFSIQVKDLGPHTTKSMNLTPRLEKPLNSVRSYASTVPGESDEEDFNKKQTEQKAMETSLFLQKKVEQYMSKRLSAQILRKKATSLGNIGKI